MDLDAIETRANACLPGPWTVRENADYETEVVPATQVDDAHGRIALCGEYRPVLEAEARFIAHARTDVPALIARVRELEEENRALREKMTAINLVKTWTNEDGHSFMFTDDLLLALGEVTPEALSRARQLKED